MTPGAEACPYLDRDHLVVYKLFDLRINGSLGKKLIIEHDTDGGFEVKDDCPATLLDTIQKLALLNDAGGLPTEIVGLSDDGNYLIAKQPLAHPYEEGTFRKAREEALNEMKCAIPPGSGLRKLLGVVHWEDRSWIVGDFHERNIMVDFDRTPTVIDALVGSIPPRAQEQNSWLQAASAEAEEWQKSGEKPVRKTFDDVLDNEL